MKQQSVSEEDYLQHKGLRPTANRILVLRAVRSAGRPVNLAAIEEMVGTLDRASIFRALRDMAEHDVLHTIDDGSGSVKYEPCHGLEECDAAQGHVHFTCGRCGQTRCLEEIRIPLVNFPDGYEVHHINYMAKGICPSCSGKPR